MTYQGERTRAMATCPTVIRAWFDRDALSRAMGLDADHQLLLSQTAVALKSAQRVRYRTDGRAGTFYNLGEMASAIDRSSA